MIFKIKKFLLLIFLLLLQSCAGGRIGNFLESSFDDIENINKSEERKDVLENKKVLNLEKKSNKANKKKKVNNSFKKTKNELQSYKIIFILKDVDPQDPIKELSTILRNSEVNFEIEKIERFHDFKK